MRRRAETSLFREESSLSVEECPRPASVMWEEEGDGKEDREGEERGGGGEGGRDQSHLQRELEECFEGKKRKDKSRLLRQGSAMPN